MIIKDDERVDDLQRNGYRIIQKKKGFCFGMDAVLLSGFARADAGEKVLDLGTGTGIIPILMEAKTEGEHFTGLEIQEEMAEMADRSVRLNHLEEKVNIVCGDLKEASRLFGAASFDVVTSPGGRFYMVHRPHRLTEIITALTAHKLEPKRMKFVHPYIDREANMVLIEAVRGGKPMVKLEKPIIVYKEPGVYTDEIYDIYGY